MGLRKSTLGRSMLVLSLEFSRFSLFELIRDDISMSNQHVPSPKPNTSPLKISRNKGSRTRHFQGQSGRKFKELFTIWLAK